MTVTAPYSEGHGGSACVQAMLSSGTFRCAAPRAYGGQLRPSLRDRVECRFAATAVCSGSVSPPDACGGRNWPDCFKRKRLRRAGVCPASVPGGGTGKKEKKVRGVLVDSLPRVAPKASSNPSVRRLLKASEPGWAPRDSARVWSGLRPLPCPQVASPMVSPEAPPRSETT
jgi:hypothetical protein